MNNYGWLFIGFMFGIILAIIIKIVFNCKIVRRNRNTMIVPRRRLQTVHVIPQPLYSDTDTDSVNYSISIDENNEETKEQPQNINIRIAENV